MSYVTPAPVVEYIAPAASYVTPAPVDEYIARVPAVDAAPAPVVVYCSPAPVGYAALAPVLEFIAPSSATQFFLSLSRQRRLRRTSLLAGTPRVEGASRLRQVLGRDVVLRTRAGNVLDVQVERVMRASAARLGYEWRRTKRREKQLAETLLHHVHTVTLLGLLGGGPWSDPCSFCDRWCGHSCGLLGAQCRVPRAGDSGAGAADVCDGQVGDQGGGDGAAEGAG